MKTFRRYWLALVSCGIGGFIAVLTVNLFADVPTPVLTINPLGSNQFSITVTNGATNVNYELYWTPALSNPEYPWQLLSSGSLGQTNWTLDAGGWPYSYFRASVGNDWDGDSVPNWMDANPNDPSIGALTITIDSPINGFTFN